MCDAQSVRRIYQREKTESEESDLLEVLLLRRAFHEDPLCHSRHARAVPLVLQRRQGLPGTTTLFSLSLSSLLMTT